MATKKATYQYDNGTSWDEIMFKTTADQVVENSSKRFVTDTEKSNWNDARTKALDWNTFKNNGGEIKKTMSLDGIHLIINRISDKTLDSNFVAGDTFRSTFYCDSDGTTTMRTDNISKDKQGNLFKVGPNFIVTKSGNDMGDGNLLPSTKSEQTLGSETNAWKDLYIGSVDKNLNGYTKLPNGMIMQWGTHTFEGTGHAGEQLFEVRINFPITFSRLLNVSFSAGTNHYDYGKFNRIGYRYDLTTTGGFSPYMYIISPGGWHIKYNWLAIGY